MEKARSRRYRIGVLRILTLAVSVLAGCMGVEDGGNDAPPAREDSSPGQLPGEWEFFPKNAGETSRYIFGNNGSFRSTYESPSGIISSVGSYSVIDSMAHIVIHKGGVPTEEVWLRFSIREDTMTMYKGIVLNGESGTLVGEWSTASAVPDSAGAFPVYNYVFTANGLLLRSYPGSVDTSAYRADGTFIKILDESNNTVEYNLVYHIGAGRLSLHTLETGRRLFRVR